MPDYNTRTWKPKFVPAHRRRRDPLEAAQLAPKPALVQFVCAECEHPALIHDNGRCKRFGCTCDAEDNRG